MRNPFCRGGSYVALSWALALHVSKMCWWPHIVSPSSVPLDVPLLEAKSSPRSVEASDEVGVCGVGEMLKDLRTLLAMSLKRLGPTLATWRGQDSSFQSHQDDPGILYALFRGVRNQLNLHLRKDSASSS